MHDNTDQLTAVELAQGRGEVLASPRDTGEMVAIFVRPTVNAREELTAAKVSSEGGIEGDRWLRDSFANSTMAVPIRGARYR